MAEFDPAPYFWLQGIVGLGALLTEQRAARLIDRLEELRRDLPVIRSRHDPEATALQQSMNSNLVLAARDEHKRAGERSKPAGEAKEDASGNE